MKSALKWGIVGAAGVAIALALKNISDENEETAEQTKLELNAAVAAAQEANQKNLYKFALDKQTFEGNTNFHDKIIAYVNVEAGKRYYILTWFWGSAEGIGVVGAATEGAQIRFPQPEQRDYAVSLPCIYVANETKQLAIRILHHGTVTISGGDITVVEF